MENGVGRGLAAASVAADGMMPVMVAQSRRAARPARATLLLLVATLWLAGCVLTPGRVRGLVDSPDARPLVRPTATGAVQGVATARAQVFLGIPFAAAPTGRRRFAPPQPAAPWVGVRPARRAGPNCGDGDTEDCLNLNIYAPHDASPAHPRPVLVWIYGGAFVLGANDQYDLSGLAERQGLVVVAPNYRLGALGFLAHPALAGPGAGAYGLLDQQAALRWVQANIAGFGGDPATVTAAGESAGAFSVCALMASPGARGLFARAILQSGPCVGRDATIARAEAERAGLAVAARLGCGYPPTAAACLRALPAGTFSWLKSQRLGLSLKDGWTPVHGGDVLPLAPDDAFAQGRYARLPTLQGTTTNEGALFSYLFTLAGRLRSAPQVRRMLDDSFHDHAAVILEEYGTVLNASRWQATAQVVTDARFACPASRMNRLLAAGGASPGATLAADDAPIWAYEFDAPDAPFGLPLFFLPGLGAFHSSEIAYVLQRPWVLSGRFRFTPAQQALADRVQDYWGRFARTGNPNGDGADHWPRHAPGDEPFRLAARDVDDADPGSTPDPRPFAVRHHCAFWNGLGY